MTTQDEPIDHQPQSPIGDPDPKDPLRGPTEPADLVEQLADSRLTGLIGLNVRRNVYSLGSKAEADLQRLADRNGITNGEALHRAVVLYAFMDGHWADGDELLVRKEDGETFIIELSSNASEGQQSQGSQASDHDA
jgi:hypothetical protein